MAKPKLEELIVTVDPAIKLLEQWVSEATVPCELLPPGPDRENALLARGQPALDSPAQRKLGYESRNVPTVAGHALRRRNYQGARRLMVQMPSGWSS